MSYENLIFKCFFFKPKFPILTCQSPAGYLNDLVKDWTKIYIFIFNLENVNVVENLEDSLITGTTPWLPQIRFTRISKRTQIIEFVFFFRKTT